MVRNNFNIFLLANCIVEAIILILYGEITIKNIVIAFIIALLETILYLFYVFIGTRRHKGVIIAILAIVFIVVIFIFQEPIKDVFRGDISNSFPWMLRLIVQAIAFIVGIFL